LPAVALAQAGLAIIYLSELLFRPQQVRAKHPNGLRILVYLELVEGFVLASSKDLAVSLLVSLGVNRAI